MLQNSKDEALSSAFHGEPSGILGPWGGAGLDGELQDLTKLLIAEVKSRPGNGQCCDCGAAGPWWGHPPPGGRWEWRGGAASPEMSCPLCRPHVAQHQPGRAHLHPVFGRPPRAGCALLAYPVPHLGPAVPLGVVGESGFPASFDQEAGLGTMAQPELGGWVTGVEEEGGEGKVTVRAGLSPPGGAILTTPVLLCCDSSWP